MQNSGAVVWGDINHAFGSFSGTTLKMEKDASSTANFTLASGKTLDLNGKTLTVGGGTLTIEPGATVNNGSIVAAGGTVKVNGGTFTSVAVSKTSGTFDIIGGTFKNTQPNASCINASYKATATDGGSTWVIEPDTVDISTGTTITLNEGDQLYYNSADQTVSIASVVKDNNAVTYNIVSASSTMTARNVGTYTITIQGNGNFTGTATKQWKIVNSTGAFAGVAAAAPAATVLNGTALTVFDSTKLVYNGGGWWAGITFDWGSSWDASKARFEVGGTVYTGNDFVNGVISFDGGYLSQSGTTTMWWKSITVDQVDESTSAITQTIKVGSVGGVAFNDYTITFPAKDVIQLYSGEDGTERRRAWPEHTHAWQFAATDGKLEATCAVADCDKSSVEIALTGSEDTPMTYKNVAYTCTRSDKTAFEVHTGYAVSDEIAYYGVNGDGSLGSKLGGAPKDVGKYAAVVTATKGGDTKTLRKDFEITPLDISSGTVSLDNTAFDYDLTEKSVSITGVTAGGLTVDTYATEGSTFKATAYGTYTVKVQGKGNFKGEATASWNINNYSGVPKSVAAIGLGDVPCGTYDDSTATLTVTDGANLVYEDGVWYAGLTLTWDKKTGNSNTTVDPERGYAIFTRPDLAMMTIGGTTYTGQTNGDVNFGDLTNTTDKDTYTKNLLNDKDFTYLKTTTWRVKLTPETIAAAKAADKDCLVYEMEAGALPFEQEARTQRSAGIAFRTYTIKIDLSSVELVDPDMTKVTINLDNASFEYDGTEKTVKIQSVMLGGYTLEQGTDYTVDGASVFTAVGDGHSNTTYRITLNGAGRFKNSKTVEWTITPPTREFAANPLTATHLDGGSTAYASCEGHTLTVVNPTLLPYNNGWYAGFVIEYPNTFDTWAYNAQVTDLANLRFRTSTDGIPEGQYYTGTQVANKENAEGALTAIGTDSHEWKARAGNVTYATSVTWWAPAITPAIVEQAAKDGKSELSYTATLGGIKWTATGSSESTTFQGVKFTDFTIKVPLKDFVFALPANETYDIGATVLSAAKIRLAAGSSVTTTAEQAEGKIYTEVAGYQVYKAENAGTYTYTCVKIPKVTIPDVTHATKVVKVGDTEITGEGNVYTVNYGDTVTVVYTPATGYETAAGTKTLANVTADAELADLPTISATNYAITYDLAGGAVEQANLESYTIETPSFKLNNPTKAGYTFGGWKDGTDANVGMSVEIAQGSTGARAFTATWNLITYDVVFLDAATYEAVADPMTYTVETGASFELPSLPARDNCSVAGWLADPDGADADAVTSFAITPETLSNKTYYARYAIESIPTSNDSDAPAVVIPQDYIDLIVDTEGKSTGEVMAEMTEPDEKGITKVERYVLQLKMDDVNDVPVIQPVQTSDATTVRVNVANIKPLSPNVVHAVVRYSIETSSTPDFAHPEAGAKQPEPTFDLPLPTSGVMYYRAKIDLVKPE